MRLKETTVVTLTASDVLSIITDEICGYSSFAGLRGAFINQTAEGDFEVTFEPKPESEKEEE